MTVTAQQPRVISLAPGRLRLHVPGGCERQRAVEEALQRLSGTHGAQLNALTGNVLVHFDSRATTAEAIVTAATAIAPPGIDIPAAPPAVQRRAIPPIRLVVRRSEQSLDVACRIAMPPAGFRWLLEPAVWRLALKGAGVAVSLLAADSPLGLIAGGVELARLLATTARSRPLSEPATEAIDVARAEQLRSWPAYVAS